MLGNVRAYAQRVDEAPHRNVEIFSCDVAHSSQFSIVSFAERVMDVHLFASFF